MKPETVFVILAFVALLCLIGKLFCEAMVAYYSMRIRQQDEKLYRKFGIRPGGDHEVAEG